MGDYVFAPPDRPRGLFLHDLFELLSANKYPHYPMEARCRIVDKSNQV